MARSGRRHWQSLPHAVIYSIVGKPDERMQPFGIDRHMADNDTVPVAGGLRVIGTSGHRAAQLASPLAWRAASIAGNVFTNIFGLADQAGFQEEAEGRRSQRKIASPPAPPRLA